MTVRWRLLLTLGGIIMLLVIPAAYGVTQLRRLRDLAVNLEVYHSDDVLALGNLRAAVSELDRLLRSYVATPEEPLYREGIRTQLTLAEDNLALLGSSGYAKEIAPTAAFLDSLSITSRRLETLAESGQLNAATNYFVSTKALLDSARLSLTSVAEALDARGQQAVLQARQVSASAARTTMLVVTIALLLTIALGLWTTDALSRPLRRLSEATGTVADGEFETPVDLPYDRTDEIGLLSRSFGTMTERLAELDRLKAEFVSLATHELKTPINVIAGYAELLEEGLYGSMDAKQREIMVLIQEQTQSLTRLVNQLLDLSRFEAGGLRVEPYPVDPARLLNEVEQSFRALATQKRIDFEVSGEPSLPTTLRLDHDRMRHEVLGNLLSNAFKFTEPGGRISVRAWGEDGRVHMEVEDTGVGIPADQLAHIFDKYYQVGAEAKAKGSGLGLAIAKHVVEAHDGTIAVDSTVGRGTTFHIVLPAGGTAGS